jgi:hypothetical protein
MKWSSIYTPKALESQERSVSPVLAQGNHAKTERLILRRTAGQLGFLSLPDATQTGVLGFLVLLEVPGQRLQHVCAN